jgi:hypothetical protein
MAEITAENLRDYIGFLEGLRTDSDDVTAKARRLIAHAPPSAKKFLVDLAQLNLMIIGVQIDVEIRRLEQKFIVVEQEELNAQ